MRIQSRRWSPQQPPGNESSQDGNDESNGDRSKFTDGGRWINDRGAGYDVPGAGILPRTISEIVGDIDGNVVEHDGSDNASCTPR